MRAHPFEVYRPLTIAYQREAMFAVELLDPLSLERVSQGIGLVAVGLAGPPIVNFGGLFVWLKQPMTQFTKLIVEPGTRPFERMEIAAAQVAARVNTIELKPLASYPFTPGITVIRGALYDTRVAPGVAPVPLAGATIRLAWLHEDKLSWIASPATALTDAHGDFTVVLRRAPADIPALDEQGNMSLRLFAKRATGGEKHREFQLPHGRVADLTFAWNELV